MSKAWLLPVLATVSGATSAAQAPTQPPQSPQQMAAAIAKLHRGWGAQLSTPGVTLELKEIAREGATVRYQLRATGMPKDGSYILIQWAVTQKSPSEMLRGVTIGDSGVAVCAGRPGTCGTPEKPNDPVDLVFSPVKGEPVRVGLVSLDGKTRALARVVPVPNEASDHGCHLESVLLTPHAELIAIEGSGFPENSDVAVETASASKKERHDGTEKTASDGTFFTVIMPYTAGETRGVTAVRVHSKQCSPELTFDWGR